MENKEENPNSSAKEDKSQKKKWQPRNAITGKQKIIIGILFLCFPILVYVILPLYARSHFCKFLKLPPEVFLTKPRSFKLIKLGEIGKTYKININGYEFAIPEQYTPSDITENSIDLTNSPRSDARKIHIYADVNDNSFKFTNFGLSRWFMPTKPVDYMSTILYATWHPVRLMFKAQFYANEGLNSQVYKTNFPNNHIGYIYPTANKDGYKSRIYNKYDNGFFELTYRDTVNPPTLRDWTDLASQILPISNSSDIPDGNLKTEYNLDELVKLANQNPNDGNLIGLCASEFFRTKSPEWLIPIAIIMKYREYYIDLNDLHKKYAERFVAISPLRLQWDKIMDEAVEKIVKIEIDPTHKLRELSIFCKNLTQLEIEDIRILVKVANNLGKEKSFTASLVTEGRILPMLEKHLYVKVPENINLQTAKEIKCKVTQIDFKRR